MYRKLFIPTINVFTKTLHSQKIRIKNGLNTNVLTKGTSLCRPLATSSSAENLKKIDFDDMKRYTNDKNVLVIDVREPKELIEHGVLPGSINIPAGEIESTLKNMSETQFVKKYGRTKPDENTLIVFSCMGGRRSAKAQVVASQLGYKNVADYTGGWNEWIEKSRK